MSAVAWGTDLTDEPTGRERMLARLGVPILLLTATAVSLRPGLENDAWWHLASGRWMLRERQWLRVDVFSWTMNGEPWPRPGLIADIGMAAVHRVGGLPLLVVVAAALFVAAIAIVLSIVEASPMATLAVGVLAILTMVVSATPRPLVASLPLTAICIVLMERERQSTDGSRALWMLPIIAVVWVNTHGAFVVLFALLGCYGLAVLMDGLRGGGTGWRRRFGRLLLVSGLSIAAIAVNPFGVSMLVYPLQTLELTVLQETIHEWRRPTLGDPQFWPLFLLLVAAAVAVATGRHRIRTVDVVSLVVFGGLALTAARHASIFAVVAFPIVPRLLSRRPQVPWRPAWRSATLQERRIEGALLATIVALMLLLTLPAMTVAGNQAAVAAFHGDQAISRVAQGDLPGRLWNSYDLGGHVIWLGSPDVLVSIDSRTDLYGDDAVREHVAEWYGRRDAPSRFAERGIGVVLVERRAPLVNQLEVAGWQRVVEDRVAVVLTAAR